jgi:uncharacterized membrane protein
MFKKKLLTLLFIVFSGFFFVKNAYAGSLYDFSFARDSATAGATGLGYCFYFKNQTALSGGD